MEMSKCRFVHIFQHNDCVNVRRSTIRKTKVQNNHTSITQWNGRTKQTMNENNNNNKKKNKNNRLWQVEVQEDPLDWTK